MNRQRYSNIAHTRCEFACPVSLWRASELLVSAGVAEGKTLLDIGCGFGAWTTLASNRSISIGVDYNEVSVERARRGPTSATFIIGTAKDIDRSKFDVILCIGSTHALGGIEATLEFCQTRLNSGGKLVLGDGFWARKPDLAYLEVLGAGESDFTTHAENAARVSRAGYHLLHSCYASQEEWDNYEGRYRSSMLEWCENNPLDPDAEEFRAQSDRWYNAYLLYGRDTLGFGFYVVSQDTPQLK